MWYSRYFADPYGNPMAFDNRKEWLKSNELAISHGMMVSFPDVPLDGILDSSTSIHVPSTAHDAPSHSPSNKKLNLDFVGYPGESNEDSQTRSIQSYLYALQHSLTNVSLHVARMQQELNQIKSVIRLQREEIASMAEQLNWCKEWILGKTSSNKSN
jgi:hypothetical protein